MTKQDLNQWDTLRRQVRDGYYMSEQDKRDLLRLNMSLMEETHEIHNNNMLNRKI